ncbi:MAG: branched-chain amino acid ABC transporter permease [Christensenellaceae bacterium]|jgi:branched-chain amino acid transport system permease protein|nr:branched-chain amino acid ABC transporter permease [Christensenellaceae bacterium]
MNMKKLPVFVLLAVAAVLPLFVKSEYFMHICVLAMMYIMLTQGLNLLTGYIGQLSLGHQTFLGLGGYASALLAIKLGVPVLLAMLLAGLFTVVCSFLIGLVTFRMRGSYFVIMTTAFAEIVRLVINNSTAVTNGPMGLREIPPPVIFGLIIKSKISSYYFGLVLAVITVFICYRIVDSRTGRAFVALREHEALANSVGISFARYSMVAAVVGGFFAGIAGGFYAHYTHFISTDVITFSYTVTILLMLIIGGKGTIMGPVLGAIIFSFVPEALRAVDNLRLPIYGLILMISVLAMPKGLMPVLSRAYGRIVYKLAPGQKTPAAKGE